MKKLYAFDKTPGKIDLSLSENPLGCSNLVSDLLQNISLKISHYPTNAEQDLKTKLADFFELEPANFFVANGSSALISSINQNLIPAGSEAILPRLTFPMFKICAEIAELIPTTVEMNSDLSINLDNLINAISFKTRLISFCNPNNPTGTILSTQEIKQFIKKVPSEILVVIDEANIDFGGESIIRSINDFPNLIVLRTFSKGFGLANLRVGFAAMSQELVYNLEDRLPPFNSSELNLQLATKTLEDLEFLAQTKDFVAKQRQFLVESLTSLDFVIAPTGANNLFCRIPKKAPANFKQLLENQSVSVIWGSNFEDCDDSFFRISVRDQKTNQKFIKIVSSILESKNVN